MEHTPFLAKTGFVIGIFIGLVVGAGVLSLGFALAGLWLGNATNALMSKEIVAHIAHHWRPEEQHYVANEQPGEFWFQVLTEFLVGFMALFGIMNQL